MGNDKNWITNGKTIILINKTNSIININFNKYIQAAIIKIINPHQQNEDYYFKEQQWVI